MISSGQRDQRITFQGNTTVSDGMGGQVNAWAEIAENPRVWAHAKPVRGAEAVSEGRTVAEGAWLFTIRFRRDVSETNRILWNDEIYNITNVKRTTGRNRLLVIEAERGMAT